MKLFGVKCVYSCWKEFDDARDAKEAVYELNHKEMLGERY